VNRIGTCYTEERAPAISVAPATQISMHVELATSKTKLYLSKQTYSELVASAETHNKHRML